MYAGCGCAGLADAAARSRLAADLRDHSALASVAAARRDVDILVNNAGDIPAGVLERIDAEKWRHAWQLKVFGYIDLSRLVYAGMKARGGGIILNTIGVAGER